MMQGAMDYSDPLTRWQACWDWAQLVLEQRVASAPVGGLTPEQEVTWTGADRGLVVVLLAAVFWERRGMLELVGERAQELPLDAPDEAGATGTLRRGPVHALESAPAAAGFGGSECRALLEAAAGDGDGRLLWERVRAAAVKALEEVVLRTRPRAANPGGGVVVRDLLVSYQRARTFAVLESVLGTQEDY